MRIRKWYRIYRDGAAAGAAAAGTADAGAAGAGEGNGEKTFTQKQVDDLIGKRLAREKSEKEALVKQLETFKQNTSLSEKAQEELQGQIDTLNNSLLTKDQQSAQERQKLEKKHADDLKKAGDEAGLWKNRFTTAQVNRAITDAAVSAGAEDPSQFVLMFSSLARLEEAKDADGKATGEFLPMVRFQGLDKDKKPAILDLPVGEAFATMKEAGLHKNLFKHSATPGTGEAGSGKGGRDNNSEPNPSDYASQEEYGKAYQTYRDTHDLDGNVIKK